ncbi:ABC transporter ATP-binding protein [Thermomonas sp.]|uniref:ABC transporter ATP-binding protein n=1 Tax=Thermomonas sp. TaxID=1971895 RepID=UPI0024871BF3|nr:ABC transporter ATP-binding protein [Thermomonas sp.]MDI1253518.1 ABC transporter ATP-binding protein [Thermomonas sp.]
MRDVDFEIAEGEAVGIIGGNGAGKSTLLKVLSRITPPTLGRASVRGRLSSLLEVGTGFHPELTGRENVFLNGAILGMRKAEVERKFDEIVAFSGVEKFIDTPVKRYSSGMYVRLAFAVAAHLEPDVLIIDEVLAVGDIDFQKRCLGKMNDVASEGRTVIFVSHNMAAVQKLCSKAIWMKDGRVARLGETGSVIGDYLESSSQPLELDAPRAPGCLYTHEPVEDSKSDAHVTSLQLSDMDGRPLDEAATFSPLRFRMSFTVKRQFRSFSAVLQVNTADGVPLMLTSTTPDQQQPFSVVPGQYTVDCEFDQFPLAAGEYVLGLGLAIPGIEYVWRNDAVCRLHVAPRDVFASGLPPASNRYLVATPHRWSAPQPGEASTKGHVDA